MKKTHQPKKLILFGISPFAEMMTHYFNNESDYEVVAFTVSPPYKDRETAFGYPLVAFDQLLQLYPPDDHAICITVEYSQFNQNRYQFMQEAKALGYSLASFVHPSINQKQITMGEHCILLENATIQPGTQIGNNVIINARAFIGQNVTIGDNCYIGACAEVYRSAKLAPFSTVLSGCQVLEGVEIAEYSYFQAFDKITHNISQSTLSNPLLRATGVVVDKR